MEDLVDDRDVLLQARAKDLEHEYENLVRSLDAAYNAVRQINTAMSENRSEAKRVFQERLELLASRPNANKNIRQNYDRINAVTHNAAVDNSIAIGRGSDGVPRKQRAVLVTPGHEKLARYVIALAAKKNKGATKTTASVVAAQNNSSRAASDAIAPSLIYYSQQKTATPQRVGIKGYVGDEHSYAEIDTKTGLLGHSVTQEEANNSAKRDGTEIEVDLSIVKSELDEESNGWETRYDSTVDDPCSSRDHSASDSATPTPTPSAITLTTTPQLKVVQREAYEYKIRGRQRKKVEEPMDEEALKRKRVMTRNRMRRWRAKKRLEQMTDVITNRHYLSDCK